MKDRLEKNVLLPFTAGCISESSIPIVQIQHTKRSKQGNNSAPTGKHEAEKKDEDDGYLNDEESLSGQNWKTTFPMKRGLSLDDIAGHLMEKIDSEKFVAQGFQCLSL